MKALVYEGPRSISFKDVDDIEDLGPEEEMIRVSYAGICGSDVHGYLGHDPRRRAPLILGHEASGRIVGGDRDGARVVFNPLSNCKSCRECHEGRTHLCPNRKMMSITPYQGCFAEYVKVEKSNVVELPDNFPLRHAALVEPMSCCWHAVDIVKRISYTPLESCRHVIIGGGTIGVGIALILRAMGASYIWISEPNQNKIETIRKFGDFVIFDPTTDKPRDHSADVVFDAYGGNDSRINASSYIRPGGVVLHIGLAGGDSGLDFKYVTLQEILFAGCYTYTHKEFLKTLDSMVAGELGDLDLLLEMRDIKEGAKSFEDIVEGRSHKPKIMLSLA